MEEDFDSDPDWQGEYKDFQSEEEGGGISPDHDAPSFSEDPLHELGLYNSDEDVLAWQFDKVFADDQWQDQSMTLLQNTDNFSGPIPGPTSVVASRPIDYFMWFWPPHIL